MGLIVAEPQRSGAEPDPEYDQLNNKNIQLLEALHGTTHHVLARIGLEPLDLLRWEDPTGSRWEVVQYCRR